MGTRVIFVILLIGMLMLLLATPAVVVRQNDAPLAADATAFAFCTPPIDATAIAPQRLAVLTRTGRRAASFARLRETLLHQRLGVHRVRHILSNDNPACDFLPSDATVVPVTFQAKRDRGHCPYNAYFGAMMQRVDADEWILLLDDDAKLLRDTYLAELLDHVATLDPATHFGVPLSLIDVTADGRPKGVRPFVERRRPAGLNVDTSNLVLHASQVRHLAPSEKCGGDKLIFEQLLAARLKPVVIAIQPGIWANYQGYMEGR